jgi:hypothetical protein
VIKILIGATATDDASMIAIYFEDHSHGTEEWCITLIQIHTLEEYSEQNAHWTLITES